MALPMGVHAEDTGVVQLGENGENGTVNISKTVNTDGTGTTVTVTSSQNVTGDIDLSILEEMGDTVKIGKAVFAQNDKITSVILPQNTISIGAGSFELCTKLSSINIPDNCTVIYTSAFNGAGLTEVVFPEKLEKLGNNSFYWNDKLLKCVFKNPELDLSISGLDYKNSYRTEPLVFWCDDGTSENCPSAFAKANGIKRLMLDGSEVLAENQKRFVIGTGTITVEYGEEEKDGVKESVSIIGSDGVQGEIDLSFLETEAVHVIVGQSAFENNTDITSVILPDNTIEIGKNAFSKCSSLEECNFPDGIEVIEAEAFRGVKLLSIKIPSSCKMLGNGAFQTAKIKSISFEEGEKELTIGNDAFRFCSNLATVNLPKRLVSIGSSAFSYCSSLTGISIPDNCSTIGGGAFQYATSLKIVKLPSSLQGIEWSCFSACKVLTDIRIPSGCEHIDMQAFCGCSALKSITIPESCTIIGNQVFGQCTSLETVIFENPDTEINAAAFTEANTELVIYSSISSKENSPYKFSREYQYEWKNILLDVHVEKPISKTEYFYGEDFDYSTIVLKGDYKTDDGYITKTIPASEWTMSGYDKYVFGKQQLHFVCDEVQDSSNVQVFVYYDMDLVEVIIENQNYTGKAHKVKPSIYWVDDKNDSHTLAEGRDYQIVSYSNNTNASKGTNQAVVNIEGMGNYKGTITKSFVIEPADIKDCEITIVENVPVVKIVDLSGDTDTKLTLECGKDYLISFDNSDDDTKINAVITGINNYTGVRTVSYDRKTESESQESEPQESESQTSEPKPSDKEETTVKTLKKGDKFTVSKKTYLITGKTTVTFLKCTDKKVKKLVIPKTVKKNGKTYKVTKIASKACYKYSKLTSVTVGDNVTSIGDKVFGECPKLLTVTIGTNVTTLGKRTFYKDKKLKRITFKTKKLKKIGEDSFKGVYKKVRIVVPKSKVKAYNRLING